jgi:hypothetical protein
MIWTSKAAEPLFLTRQLGLLFVAVVVVNIKNIVEKAI